MKYFDALVLIFIKFSFFAELLVSPSNGQESSFHIDANIIINNKQQTTSLNGLSLVF